MKGSLNNNVSCMKFER